MTPNADHPDPRLVADLLLGRLADADAEPVAARLAGDPRWQALAQAEPPADPLVEAVRDTAKDGPPEETALLRDLMDRLERLSLSSAVTRTSAAGTDTAAPAGPTTAADGLSFLRPAQAPGELGRLAGFRILEVLGRGGMGLVFRAEDVQLRRHVALKVIKPDRAADPSHRERFLREARAAAALQHDHVMPVHQIGEDNGVLFLAMPLLAGETLEARLGRERPLTVAEQLRVVREMALGLAAAHARGLIHRDVKPSNVWLESSASPSRAAAPSRPPPTEGVTTHDFTASWEALPYELGRVKILDFGLALPAEGAEPLTHRGALIGTPAYMSPEQADGKPLDGRSDLFSLGCVLYRMVTGKQPFRRDSMTATLRAVAEHQPAAPHEVVPGVAPPLSDLIMRLLAKSPDDRPRSAAAVASDLRAIESGEATVEHRPARPTLARGRKTVLTAAAAALLGVLVLAWLTWWVLSRPGPGHATETLATPAATAPVSPAAVAAAHEDYVDAIVWIKAGGAAQRLRLSEAGALPLRNGDQYRIEAQVASPAYLYLFLIDTEGEANPLYPWQPGEWATRPGHEEKQTALSLPKDAGKSWKINGAGSGMWTLLLLARDTPWAATDDEIKSLFAGLPPQRPVQDERSAVWFENGRVVKNDERRRAVSFEEADVNDPVLRMQALLREKLQSHARFTAVSFAKQGK